MIDFMTQKYKKRLHDLQPDIADHVYDFYACSSLKAREVDNAYV
jgi:hypothetical protein